MLNGSPEKYEKNNFKIYHISQFKKLEIRCFLRFVPYWCLHQSVGDNFLNFELVFDLFFSSYQNGANSMKKKNNIKK